MDSSKIHRGIISLGVGEPAVNQIHPYFSGNSPIHRIHVEISHKTSEIDQVFTCVNSPEMLDYMMILNR